jgi:hypothetical protein
MPLPIRRREDVSIGGMAGSITPTLVTEGLESSHRSNLDWGGDKHRETRRGIHCIGGGGRVPGWVAISFSLSETYLDILHQEFKMSFNFPPIK